MEDVKEKMPADVEYGSHGSDDIESAPPAGGLTRALQGRHMQMIAIGTHLQALSPVCDKIKRLITGVFKVVPSVLVFSWAPEPHFKPVGRPVWYVPIRKREPIVVLQSHAATSLIHP